MVGPGNDNDRAAHHRVAHYGAAHFRGSAGNAAPGAHPSTADCSGAHLASATYVIDERAGRCRCGVCTAAR